MTRTSSFFLIVLATFTLVACDRNDEAVDHPARTSVPVTTATAAVVDLAERLEAGGVVASAETAAVSSRIVAPVVTVHARAGDRVRKGEVLITLEAGEIADHARQARAAAAAAEQAVKQAHTAQTAAEADERLAIAWHTRISSLHSKNSATAQERDEAEARLASAAARLAGARAGIEMAQANLDATRAAAGAASTTATFTAIRAPFDGVVAERFIDPGNLASPGMPLLQLESLGQRRVEVTVDEARAAFIHPGDRVDVSIDAPDGGAEDASIAGTVTEVARAINVEHRAFLVKVALPGYDHARTGTFARVRFRGAIRRSLVVPAEALRRHGQVTSIFVVEDGTAHLRLVQTGLEGPDGVAVLAGLEPGEIVITAPPPLLGDGQPVTITATRPQPGARQ